MSWKKKATIYLGLFLLLLGIVKLITYELEKSIHDFAPVLNPGDKEKVIIDNRTGRVDRVTRDESGNTVVTPIGDGSRGVSVTIGDDGKVSVSVRSHGFIFEPGASIFYSDKLRIGGDVNFYFYKRFNFGGGVGINVDKPRNLDLYAKVGYQLPFRFVSNSEVFIGYSARKEPVLGVKVRF